MDPYRPLLRIYRRVGILLSSRLILTPVLFTLVLIVTFFRGEETGTRGFMIDFSSESVTGQDWDPVTVP